MSIPKGPIFIVGMPRSGTKLLRTLLSNHPEIAIPSYETNILPYWATHLEDEGDLSNFSTFKKFYSKTRKTPFFYYSERDGRPISVREWYQSCSKYNVQDVFEALVRVSTGCNCDTIWGDKSPSYIKHIPLLLNLFPNAKVIHIVRDVRDYCLSINKAWGKNMLRAAQRWQDDTEKASEDIKDIGESGIEVTFEQLLDNPEMTLSKICSFIGISFNENMLDLKEPTENFGDAKGKVGIINTNKNKWAEVMEPALINKINMICSSQLKRYGYHSEYCGESIRINKLLMSFYRYLDAWNLVAANSEKRSLLGNVSFYLQHNKVSGDHGKE